MGKGAIILKKEKDNSTQQDLEYEGRDQVFLDIDRMMNEGMSGGSVHARYDSTNIEEARDLKEEEPPYEVE
ncbi:hypothetical protein E2K98_02730 [Bacillus salipaludis]|uniref:DUF4025 domain-containing protein n=1 Tax=Bacillus salipaludis TaxID=2547811 RepID=A0A4R5VZU4_9BACI|nr:hypothetical protein [Bacillus salipaludis]MDQ6596346.1 hypothetical protein [Bacillus salipaludis]TDK65170.1 hypothetical protein E2K98_02730 [Bacillus salipaludis]